MINKSHDNRKKHKEGVNMKSRIILLIMIITISLHLVCNVSAQNGLAGQIGANVTNVEYKLNDKTGSVIFHIDTELQNNSDVGIMEIQYRLRFLDKYGEEMQTAYGTFNGQDTPLAPGKTVSHFRGGQFKAEKKPADISVEVISALSEEELPPIYVPKAGDLVFQVLNNKNLENIKEEPPIVIKLWIDRGGARDEALLESPEEIEEFIDAFTQVRIREETNTFVTDNYNGLSMEFANGEYYWISLNLNNLEYQIYDTWHIFELTDDELFWQLMYGLTKPANYKP